VGREALELVRLVVRVALELAHPLAEVRLGEAHLDVGASAAQVGLKSCCSRLRTVSPRRRLEELQSKGAVKPKVTVSAFPGKHQTAATQSMRSSGGCAPERGKRLDDSGSPTRSTQQAPYWGRQAAQAAAYARQRTFTHDGPRFAATRGKKSSTTSCAGIGIQPTLCLGQSILTTNVLGTYE